jgi:hypothetical protein
LQLAIRGDEELDTLIKVRSATATLVTLIVPPTYIDVPFRFCRQQSPVVVSSRTSINPSSTKQGRRSNVVIWRGYCVSLVRPWLVVGLVVPTILEMGGMHA